MKTVFENSMVGHIWANQSQREARNHNNTFWFSGNTIWSYRTPIASIYELGGGERIALVTTGQYSMTTSSKHMPNVCRAVRRSVNVPFFQEPTNAKNLEFLVVQYNEAKESLRRKISVSDDGIRYWLSSVFRSIKLYCESFGLPMPALDLEADVLELIAFHEAREARRQTPEYQAKRERERERRENAKAERKRIASLERHERERVSREEWIAGGLRWWRGIDEHGGAYLRVRGENIETSQGASVPLDHAVKAFRLILECKRAGRIWKRNGSTIRVGHFQVDKINEDGSIRAGCHYIGWSEIERIATQLELV